MTLRPAAFAASFATSLAVLAAVVPPAAFAAATPPPLPPGLVEEAQWFIVIDGQKIGPLTDSAVERYLANGSLTDDTLVWREGMADWAKAKNSPGIQAVIVEAKLNGRLPKTPLDQKFGVYKIVY